MPVNDYTFKRSFGNPGKAIRRIQQMEQDGWELGSLLPFDLLGNTIAYTIVMKRVPTATSGHTSKS